MPDVPARPDEGSDENTVSEQAPEPDEFVASLATAVAALVDEVARSPEIQAEFEAQQLPEPARQEVLDLVVADRAQILASTNTAIADLREATAALAEHEANRPSQVVQQAVSAVTSSGRTATPLGERPTTPHPGERRLRRFWLIGGLALIGQFLLLGLLGAWLLSVDRTVLGVLVLVAVPVTTATVGLWVIGSEKATVRSTDLYTLDGRAWTRSAWLLVLAGLGATVGLAFVAVRFVPLWAVIPYGVLAAALTGLVALIVAGVSSPRRVDVSSATVPSADAERGWDRTRRGLIEARDEAWAQWEQAARDGVLRSLRRTANTVGNTWHFRIRLTDPRMPGLEQLTDPDFVVSSGWTDAFQRAVDSMNGGALGVAGPRGAGKTTVLAAHRSGRYLEAGRQHLAFLVQAPVEYQARDFALHLYAQLCEEVRRFAARRLPRPLNGIGGRLRTLFACLVMVAATVVLTWAFWPPETRLVWLLPLLTAVLAMAIPAYAGWNVLRRRRTYGGLLRLDRDAKRRLVRIRFLQTTTTGWSGRIGLPWMQGETSRSMSKQLAGQPLTYPEVVTQFREFLGAVVKHLSTYREYARSPVCIGIDELDKIGSDQGAQRFVNEVKALFGVPGCNFVVSVSEDALAAFERRGVPLRDAFDSAFDDIVRIDYLSAADSLRLLQERVSGVPESFLYLCHCLTGGLPRDLLRTMRRLVAYGADADDPSLAEVARFLVADDLARMCHAGRVALNRGGAEPHTSGILRRLEDLRRLTLNPSAMTRETLRPHLLELAKVPADPMPARLRQIRAESLCYLYFCSTVLDFFDDDLNRDKLGEALTGQTSLDRLAAARQLLSVNTGLSWASTSEFRRARRLPEADLPGGAREFVAGPGTG